MFKHIFITLAQFCSLMVHHMLPNNFHYDMQTIVGPRIMSSIPYSFPLSDFIHMEKCMLAGMKHPLDRKIGHYLHLHKGGHKG